jgi:predicted transcriptional regulator
MDVVRAVWKTGEGAVGDVFAAMDGTERAMDYATVQTYLRRLEAKGYLQSRRAGRAKLYRSRVQPRQVRGEAIKDLISRLFDNQPLPLVRHLLTEGHLSEGDLADLKKLLDEWE